MKSKRSETKVQASFIEPMLLLRVESLPEGEGWEYELKLDGYRALGIKTGGRVELRSRNNNDFSLRYPSIAKALAGVPNETVIDGEVVALDSSGRPSFNTLQNFGSSAASLLFYAFDVPILAGRNVQSEPLDIRREFLRTKVLSKLEEPIRYSASLEASLSILIRSAREQGFEGLVAKQRESLYEAGKPRAPGRRCASIEDRNS
jgi:bifunctional non-homologous end joining protein LigD